MYRAVRMICPRRCACGNGSTVAVTARPSVAYPCGRYLHVYHHVIPATRPKPPFRYHHVRPELGFYWLVYHHVIPAVSNFATGDREHEGIVSRGLMRPLSGGSPV